MGDEFKTVPVINDGYHPSKEQQLAIYLELLAIAKRLVVDVEKDKWIRNSESFKDLKAFLGENHDH